jgi:glycosyltransferase involved in cell wall biosynthesis
MRSRSPLRGQTLVITNWRDLDHPDGGGAEVVCENLAASYARQGQRVVYLTAAVVGRPRSEERNGYRIIRRGNRLTVYIWALAWLAWHRREVCAVIDSQNGIPFFTPLAVRRRTPVVLLLHHVHQNQMAAGLPGPLAKLGMFLEGPASRLVYGQRAIVAVSPSTRQEIRQTLKLRGAITVAPPGLDKTSGSTGRRAEHPSIVCVGRLTAHKRTGLILEMMPRLLSQFPHLELHIVGDGSCRAELEQRTADLGLGASVIFHGSLPGPVRDELLATAWMSINASAAEGWGLSVVEANALGVPVLAVRRPGLQDSIQDGETGWLVDDESELATAACQILEELTDPGVAAAWSERARDWAACFTWDEMALRIKRTLLVERERLAFGQAERLPANDAVTLLHLPRRLVPRSWNPRLRVADWVVDRPDGLVFVLTGTDTEMARHAMVQSGLPDQVASDPQVTCVVARPADLMLPGRMTKGSVHGARPDALAAAGVG